MAGSCYATVYDRSLKPWKLHFAANTPTDHSEGSSTLVCVYVLYVLGVQNNCKESQEVLRINAVGFSMNQSRSDLEPGKPP